MEELNGCKQLSSWNRVEEPQKLYKISLRPPITAVTSWDYARSGILATALFGTLLRWQGYFYSRKQSINQAHQGTPVSEQLEF